MEHTEEEKQNFIDNLAFGLGHFRYLTIAVAKAMDKCVVWRTMDGENVFTMDDLLAFAKQQDEEAPLEDPEFYMVTSEGAIGKSPGVEYLTNWLLVPLEAGEKRDAIIAQMKEQLKEEEKEEQEERGEESKANYEIPTEEPEVQEVKPAVQPTIMKKFCTQCGTPLQPGYKFCTKCGTKV